MALFKLVKTVFNCHKHANAPQGQVIAFARPDELRIHAQPQDNAIQATFFAENHGLQAKSLLNFKIAKAI